MAKPRVPSALKIIQGTAKAGEINPREPAPKTIALRRPDDLTEDAARHWPEIERALLCLGILALSDEPSLRALAEAWGDYRRIRASLTVTDGMQEARMIDLVDRRWMNWASRFGLTPADRSRVSVVEEPKPGDAWAAYG